MDCPLKIDNNHGLIFSTSVIPISGTINIERGSYEILISDRNSNEIIRRPLASDESSVEAPFTWDLKSKSNYVKSGCYTISLIDTAKEIKRCSIECKVADTRNILPITRSLKHSPAFTTDTQALSSIYFEIIEDIQAVILERLRNNRFEEPYFVACITACFIQEIADDIQNQPSRFLDLITEFQSKHHVQAARLGLRELFDFLINYMADTEDHVRANAMARCGQHHLTQNDKAKIVSSLVSAIYPHCKTKNAILEKLIGGIIKLGIKYVSIKHVSKSISICQTLPLGNPCDVVIR